MILIEMVMIMMMKSDNTNGAMAGSMLTISNDNRYHYH